MNTLLDALKTVLLPGDISVTTVSDLPVDASPRYVVEQDIIPFRSVRSPLLTPIRNVQPVLRTPIKDFAPVRGRIRNIPSLPGQEGSRMFPYGDPDMKSTGFAGLTATLNRQIVGFGQGSDIPSPIPIEGTRIMQCVHGSYSLAACGACCDRSFKNNPNKRKRCKAKCNAKGFKPFPVDSNIVSHNVMPPSDNPLLSNRSSFGQFISPSAWIANKWGQGFFGLGECPGEPGCPGQGDDIEQGLMQSWGDDYWSFFKFNQGGNGGSSGKCKSWFGDPKHNCDADYLKLGLIAAAVFLVMR